MTSPGPARLIQLVPRLPPAITGVGDYALGLAQELSGRFGIETAFALSARPGTTAAARPFPVATFAGGDAAALCRALLAMEGAHGSTVLLHFSGYGFSSRGAPGWLVRGLADWKRRASRARLGVFFHELYATGWPWQKAFWFSGLQRRACADLMALADDAITNSERFAQYLGRVRPERDIAVLPVASNAGETGSVPEEARAPRIVVWASEAARAEAFRHGARLIETAAHALRVEEIVCIGEGPDPGRAFGLPVKSLGVLSRDALPGVIADCRLGVIRYNANFLAKSTLFAGFAAHGVPVACVANRGIERHGWDGLRAGVHYASKPAEASSAEALGEIGRRAHAWYLPHRIEEHAKLVSARIARN